jgi:hypothetical protein
MNRREALKTLAAGIGSLLSTPLRSEPPTAQPLDPYKEVYRYDAAVESALADAGTLDSNEAYCSRYVALSGIHPDEYFALVQAVLFTWNSLSRNVLMLGFVPVDKGRLMRFNLKDACISPEAWENLGLHGGGPLRVARPDKDFPEPYFHQQEQALGWCKTKCEPYVHNGYTYNWCWEKKLTLVTKHAPELNQQSVAKLAKLTGTDFPIVRADWFVANALFAPIYYELLGAGKDLKSWDKIGRYHPEDNEDIKAAGTVIDSTEVSLNNRALVRETTNLGYRHSSFDYLTSVDENDLLLNVLLFIKGKKVDGKKKVRDAGEFIASLPNRLQYYAITDANDKLVNVGDTNIVVDRKTHFKYKGIYPGASCIICHDKGLKEVADEVRLVTDIRKNVRLLVLDEDDSYLVQQLFQQDFDAALKDDQALYAKALFSCNGMSPQDNAANIARIVYGYHQDQLTINEIAINCCYSPEHTRKALALGVGIDPRLSNAIGSGRGIRRDNYEATAHHHALQLCQLLDQEQKKGRTWEELMRAREDKIKARDGGRQR